jgi:putative Flp pilus-assembly TadE/G-like protein
VRARAAQAPARDDGQALPLVVVFIVVLLGFCALALDVGHAYLAQRRLQASVDAAALAGAQALPNIAAATSLAGQFGADGSNPPRGLTGVDTAVGTRCIKAAPGCSPANAVVVKEVASVATVFGKLFGVPSLTVHAMATACSPCGSRPLDIMLVLDRTGSMCTDSVGKPDPGCTDMANARNGMTTFLEAMNPQLDHVGLAVLPPATSLAGKCDKPASSSYDSKSSPYVIVPLSSDYLLSTGSLNSSSDLVSTIDCVQANGSTAYATAIDQAQATLQSQGRPDVQKVIVFLSDGAANTAPRRPRARSCSRSATTSATTSARTRTPAPTSRRRSRRARRCRGSPARAPTSTTSPTRPSSTRSSRASPRTCSPARRVSSTTALPEPQPRRASAAADETTMHAIRDHQRASVPHGRR